MHSSTAQSKMHIPLVSAAVQNRLTTGCHHSRNTCEELLFVYVRSDAAPMQSSTAQGKMHLPLLSALQNRLTANLCYCNNTYEDLLLMQVIKDSKTMHCNTVQGKMHSPLVSGAVEKQVGLAANTPRKNCSANKLAVTQHKSNAALPGQDACPIAQCCSAKQADSRMVSLQMHLWSICCSYKTAVNQHQCTAALLKAKCISHWSVLL